MAEEKGPANYEDRTITCADCGKPFVFTAGEQAFYAEKGFGGGPKRCPQCRVKRREQSEAASEGPASAAASGEEREVVPPEVRQGGRSESIAGRIRNLKGELMSRVSKPKPGGGPKGERFDKFTERAKKVLVLAQEEAQRLNHNYIGTEHLLLGLVREGEGIAGKVLTNLGIDLGRVRGAVEFIIGRGDRMVIGDISLTPRAKKVIELAVEEARHLNHNYVGTEHLLLGLVREGEGIAAGVLESLGASMDKVRAAVLQVFSSAAYQASAATIVRSVPKDNVITCRLEDRDLSAIDALVEAGIRSTRSDAAGWLIRAGIEANRTLFERVNVTVAEIRRLREQAQAMAEEITGGAGQAAPEDLSKEQEPEQEGQDKPSTEPEAGR